MLKNMWKNIVILLLGVIIGMSIMYYLQPETIHIDKLKIKGKGTIENILEKNK
jgi:hypothetical protein